MEEFNPIKTKTVIKLTDHNVDPNLMKFKHVSLQGNNHICVRGDSKISIIDTLTANVVDLKTKVDSAIMNPLHHIIALKSGNNLQVFDLQKKAKLNAIIIDQAVEFWTWISDSVIGIVSERSVSHWDVYQRSDPKQIFARVAHDENMQIINYESSEDNQWLLLGGIVANEKLGIDGILQLHSTTRARSQTFGGALAGCFAFIKLSSRAAPCNLFCFSHRTNDITQLSIIEVGNTTSNPFHCKTQIRFDSLEDFAVSMRADQKNGMVFTVTKMGSLFMHEIETGVLIKSQKISTSNIFATARHIPSSGICTINQESEVGVFSVNEECLVQYVAKTLNLNGLAINLAVRTGIAASDELFIGEFEEKLAEGNIMAAARVAESAPNNLLRTEETIAKFSAMRPTNGQIAPVLQYFSYLLKKGRLNSFESIGIVKPILSNRSDSWRKHIEEWIRKEKLTFTEALGDLLLPHDATLACSVYLRAGVTQKAIECFIRIGQFSKVVAYAQKQNYSPNYEDLLKLCLSENRQDSKEMATFLTQNNLMAESTTANILIQSGDFKSTTSFLLDTFKRLGDRPQDAALQTMLLLINIENAPKVAEAIMDSEEYCLTHYDRQKVAESCEAAEMWAKAVENFDSLEDIKRCLKSGIRKDQISSEFVVSFFGDMSPTEGIECLGELVDADEKNQSLVVEVAKRYSKQMGSQALVEMFEKRGCFEAAFNYLGTFVNNSKDSKVVFDYIRMATSSRHFKELVRVCKEHEAVDGKQAKNFLIEQDLDDPRPLIIVCDRFEFVEELTKYLYGKKMLAFIDAYVKKMNSTAAPEVVIALTDLGASDETIQSILNGVDVNKMMGAFDRLVEKVQSRSRLSLLDPWLEKLKADGLTFPALHNALGLIAVQQNKSPERFLNENEYYQPEVLGKYCEECDLKLAFTAYSKANFDSKENRAALLRVAWQGGFYSELARLLIKQQDETFWLAALSEEDEHRKSLITQAVSILGESQRPEEVSIAVKAFVAAELPLELIELLEQLVLNNKTSAGLKDNRNLQNLLVLTAMKSAPKRVMNYLHQLSGYDGPEIAQIALSSQYKLNEEAFEIYLKFEMHLEALQVLINNICDFDRAEKFAETVDKPQIWQSLGSDLILHKDVEKAISAFVKSDYAGDYAEVISLAEAEEKWDALIEYLLMARKTINMSSIDDELLYAYAKLDKLDDFKDLLESPNSAKIDQVGYRCMEDELFEAAKLVYQHSNNPGRLAVCYINLGDFEAAVEAAQQANNIPCWKAVCYACVDAEHFQLAETCAAHVITHADHLRELVSHYEHAGHFEQAIAALEKGAMEERPQSALFTELGILYCKHRPDMLMQHLKKYYGRINVVKLINVSLKHKKWPEVCFLYQKNEEYEKALSIAMEHSPSCYDSRQFNEIIVKINKSEFLYRIVEFYRTEHPLKLNKILKLMEGKVDCLKILQLFKEKEQIPLIIEFLISTQSINNRILNEELNKVHLESEDFENLKNSITKYNNFDSTSLVALLENHHLKKFRTLAAFLYYQKGDYEKALSIQRKDLHYREMIETVLASGDRKRVEKLLHDFVKNGQKHFLAIALLRCRSLIRTHVIAEIGWRYGLQQLVMPFLLQKMSDSELKIENLEKEMRAITNKEKEDKKGEDILSSMNSSMRAIMPGKPTYNGRQNGQMFDSLLL